MDFIKHDHVKWRKMENHSGGSLSTTWEKILCPSCGLGGRMFSVSKN